MQSEKMNEIQLRGGKALRTVRKLERPRPLRITSETSIGKQLSQDTNSFQRSASDEVLQEIEAIVKHINNENFDVTVNNAILRMCNQLRAHGMQLETKFKDQLDRFFVTFRNACREERLEKTSRLQLLQIIELRAMGWRFNENITNYYKRKMESEQGMENNYNQCNVPAVIPPASQLTPASTVSNPMCQFFPNIVSNVPQVQATSVLSPGEVLKSSGKFVRPTRIPGKNYYKDEIVIRNSDSGKVMGIKGRRVHMIEEFSDTVISFQRVSQGAKDRLVQITGSNEECIGQARQLIEETIRRNASPVRENQKELFGGDSCSSLNSNNSEEGVSNANVHHGSVHKGQLIHSLSMNDASIGEYQYTVTVGRDTLKISGAKLDIVRIAKLVLEEYFAGDAKRSKHDSDNQEAPYSCSEFSEEPCNEEMIPVQQSPASSNIHSFLECNGGYRERHLSSSSSGSEEETFKAFENVTAADEFLKNPDGTEDPLLPKMSPSLPSPGVMTVIRQPLFPHSPKEAFNMVESSPNFQALCAKVRRAKFAKNIEIVKDDAAAEGSSPSSPGCTSNSPTPMKLSSGPINDMEEETASCVLTPKKCVVYSRDFLLDCALSPYSRMPPKDLPNLIQEAPYLLKKVPEWFEPQAFKAVEMGFRGFPFRSTSVQEQDDES